MKQFFFRTLFLSLLFLIPNFSQAQDSQGTLNYKLQVYKKGGAAYAGCPVTLVETSTFERKIFKTNQAGLLMLELSEGQEWVVNVGEMRNYLRLTVPQWGEGNGAATATHDPAWWDRMNEKPGDRTDIEFDDIPQRWAENEQPTRTSELLEIIVQTENGTPYRDMDVKLVNFERRETYSARTDEKGAARFKLPLNSKYQIDLDGEQDFQWHDTGSKPYKKRVTLTYETIEYKEVENEDGYLEQIFLEDPKPISSRVFVALTVKGGPNGGANEDIYLDMAFSNKKYHAKTNDQGVAYLLLPKKREYVLNFEYQKGAGSVDLKRFYGIGSASRTFVYQPDERLQFPERFLPSNKDLKLYDINNYRKRKPYDDTADDNLINIHMRWGNNKIGSGAKEALLELGFSVKEPKDKKAVEKPLNIAFVLDKSGSMSGENIDILKSAMEEFVKKLRPIDNVSLVFFDTEAVLAYESQKANKSHLLDLIAALNADGGTSIYEGLKLGYKEVSKNAAPGSVNRLILLTDGYGSKPVDEVVKLSEQYFQKGISVSTIGVGQGYNSAMLSLLSKYSGGLEHQAIDSKGISEALDKEFESLLYPLASDLKVKVKYNNRVIYKSLYGIPETKNKDGIVQFELEKVFSSMNRMVLMKFKIDNPDKSIEKDKISIEITYHDEVKDEDVKLLKETGLEWTDETDVELIHDRELAQTYSVAVINQMLKTIADQCDNKNYVEARKKVKETLKSVRKINKDKFSPELMPIIETLNTYLTGLEQAIANGSK